MDTKGIELVLLLLIMSAEQVLLEYRGTRFIFGFIENNSTISPELYVIPHQAKDAFVSIKVPLDPTFETITTTIPHGEVTSITLPTSVRMANGKVGNKGIVMVSDEDIIVYGKNPTNGSSDVYLILPIDDIGDDYIAVSHRPAGQFISCIGIVATEPDTEIDITVPNLGRNISLRLGNNYCKEGQTLTVGLNIYETVQLESNKDLMGVKITANHPIALISGETSVVKFKNGTILTNHFGNQIIPTDNWGNSYVAGPHSASDNLYHIIARHNNTTVNIKKKSQTATHYLNASQHKEINVSREDYISIDADKPVSVLQYLVTHVVQGNCSYGGCGGSSLLFVPPMEQRQHQYLFSSGDSAGGKQHVNLVIATPLREGVLLNGKDVLSYINNSNPISSKTPTWSNIDSNSNVSYSAIQFLVDKGLHKITHNSTTAEFSATLHRDSTAIASQESKLLTISRSPLETTTLDAKSVNIIQDKSFSGNGAIPTAKVEKSDTNDEINNAYLAKSENVAKAGEERISHSVIAVIVTLCTAVLLVIICIVGFIFAEFAFHNGEKSLFQSARVAPYEPIEPN